LIDLLGRIAQRKKATPAQIALAWLLDHLVRARENGVAQEELVEVITHLAFYAGWPSAMTAISVARDLFERG
jgi:alkylhydroperoxidase/carboxymuconolactone decarboxylase family protein YurZ